MRCPYCGKPNVVSHVTIRWVQVRGSLVPERGCYCTACGTAFEDPTPPSADLGFRSVRVGAVSDAIRRLQESADVIVVRHKGGVHEVVY